MESPTTSPTTPPICGNSAREMYNELFKRADEKIEEQAETIRRQQLRLNDAEERLRRVKFADLGLTLNVLFELLDI